MPQKTVCHDPVRREIPLAGVMGADDEIFEVARHLPGDEREGYLEMTCCDSVQRQRIRELIEAIEHAGDFMKVAALPGRLVKFYQLLLMKRGQGGRNER